MSKQSEVTWLFQMAWRDSRRSKSRLFLFISSIILGIAALVAIYSFNDNLKKDIDHQAASLIGADLVLSTNKQPSEKTEEYLKQLGDERSSEKSFVSMILFNRSGGSRLVQVRALEGKFPFYGQIETVPKGAAQELSNSNSALVDKTVMLQFGASNGDSIRLGEQSFIISGTLESVPGQTGLSSSIAPVVYIPMAYLQGTGLMQKGSRVNYSFRYRFGDPERLRKELKSIKTFAENASMDVDTIESTKEETGNTFQNMTEFMSLVAFIALLLGCIGVASAVHIYVKEKVASVSILRCLGATASQTTLIYLIQIALVGLAGSVFGSLLGLLIQQVLPAVMRDFLPIEITASVSYPAVLQGISTGLLVSIVFSILPLLTVRKVSPLNTLRASVDTSNSTPDRLKALVYFIIIIFLVSFAYLQLGDLKQAGIFTAGIALCFLILVAIANLLTKLARRYFPSNWAYLYRQGFSNLFRPNNQTVILIVCIGLGTALISTLMLVKDMLIDKVTTSSAEGKANMVLFDIQSSQKEAVAELTRGRGLPVMQQVPIITMRIEEIRGVTASEARRDTTLDVPARAFNSEIRSTFRDSLTSSEKIVDGAWVGKVAAGNAKVYVSLEKRYAERLRVRVGDEMTFNVQGALVPVIVGSFREVDWNNIQTNFRVVFPSGVLENAPQFHVLMTRLESPQQAAEFQQAIVLNFPNISIIDLNLVLNVLDNLMDKLGFVIRFMAGFSIITGIIVLITSVLISRYQRMRENVLLRTLGASTRQVLTITALEYFFLGALAGITGILLSFMAGWGLARYNFKIAFSPDLLPSLLLLISVCMMTVVIGLLNSKSTLNAPPLEILRKEG
ncbi:putative ABC transport system permease protein [Arcticibacter pallidicorallinus]|uniref:Putative ABC transport system permease protein n=1 Tax=Arcticibacter pallidicorallinus TaxID=1259464 RepID=A0A2T0U5B1_9SPHI|nr:FtsX-like permease family protein [Arcticibacter pallidicorallinus]PRY53111.1 putative ABC transport system permease protein [Arcticibacter pallidicorallinus]